MKFNKATEQQLKDYMCVFSQKYHNIGAGGVECNSSTSLNNVSIKRHNQCRNRRVRSLGV